MKSITDKINNAIQRGLLSIRKEPPQSVSRWSNNNFFLSAESSYISGRWESYPYQAPILDMIGNDGIREIDILKSARIGYSKMLLACIGYFQEHKKRNQAIWLPTDASAVTFSKTQIDTMLRDVPSVRVMFKNSYDKKCARNTQNLKIFDNGTTLRILGGTAAKNYREISVDCAYLDELASFEPDIEAEGNPALLANKRTAGSVFPKLVCGSTPKIAGTCLITERHEKNVIKLRFYIPCPHCDKLHPLEWKTMQWEKDDPESVLHHCHHCGAGYNQSQFLSVWEKGRYQSDDGIYYHEGFFYDSDDSVIETPLTVGIHIWTAYSPMQTWSQIVREWLSCYKDPILLRTFINTTLGEADKEETESVDPDTFRGRAEEYERFSSKAVCLTMGVDVQPDRLEFEIVAWNANEESWSVDYQILWGDTIDSFEVWDELKEWLIENYKNDTDEALPISMALIDSGFSATTVYKCVERLGLNFVYSCKGQAGKRPVVEHEKERKRRMLKARKKGGHPIIVGVDEAKSIIYRRMRMVQAGAGYMHTPKSRDEEWYNQMTIEQLETKYQRGFAVQRWIKPNGGRNEALDCRVYAYAAFKMTNGKYRSIANSVAPRQIKRRVRQK